MPKYDIDQVVNEPKREKIPASELGLKGDDGYHNIMAIMKKATPEEIDYWGKWYQHANKHVQKMANYFDLPVPIVAAVAAVTSPGSTWKNNLQSAKRVMENWYLEEEPKTYKQWEKVSAYPANIKKANKILETGSTEWVRGPKVSVFYQSLLNPDEVKKDVVLDGHAINIWRGTKIPIKSLRSPGKAERTKMIEDYEKVADELGMSPQAVQATSWMLWKAVYDPPKTPQLQFDLEQPGEMNEVRNRLKKQRLQEVIEYIVSDFLK